MRSWRLILGPMLVWALHFFSLYLLGSVWESGAPARWGTGAMTLICLALDLWLLAACRRVLKAEASGRRWPASVGAVSAALSAVAVIWQGLPALLA